MNQTNNSKLTKKSQDLRKNMTKEERRRWYNFLRNLPLTINRQKVIGNYIADFYCASAKFIIELDGSQHYEPTMLIKDSLRDEYFTSLGFTVLRYSNFDINHNFNGVCLDIMKHIPTSSTTSGPPSPQGDGKE